MIRRTEDCSVETAGRMEVSDVSASLTEESCDRRSSCRDRTSERSCFSRRRMPSWIFSARAATVPEESASEEKRVESKSEERNLEKIGSDANESMSDEEDDEGVDEDVVLSLKVGRGWR
ncbi:hypothetical protein QVD17_05006 [Tagetes erecta]|uniref:Uncharacterized protein n=1 Tax=Tagetes erecta TaxID=13708 RepID=A0AAD8LB70_TARER|nr:hypothetical protein QVD17_05006 [Tagetes erecta]